MNARNAKDKTEHMELTELVSHLYAAIGDPKGWDADGLMGDAAHKLNAYRRILRESNALVDQVREIAIIIRETSSPINIIAMDVFERLRRIERTLMEWTGEIEPSESES
jgi:hypothetical protein